MLAWIVSCGYLTGFVLHVNGKLLADNISRVDDIPFAGFSDEKQEYVPSKQQSKQLQLTESYDVTKSHDVTKASDVTGVPYLTSCSPSLHTEHTLLW